MHQYFEQVLSFDFKDKIASLNIPTLIIAGTRDLITPNHYAKFIYNKVKNSKYYEVENGTLYSAF